MATWGMGAFAAPPVTSPGGLPIPIPSPSPSPPEGLDLLLPSFDYTAQFLSPAGPGVLKAEETGWFRLELKNLEDHPVQGVIVSYQALAPLGGLPPSGLLMVGDMAANATRSVDLPLRADRAVVGGAVDYVLEVKADRGLYGPPARITLRTRPFVAPRLNVVSVDLEDIQGEPPASLPAASTDSASGSVPDVPNGLRRGQRAVLRAQIQNLGGPAREVRARFTSVDPGVSLAPPNAVVNLGDMRHGQARAATVSVVVDPGYSGPSELPVWIEVSERHADLGFRERLPLPLLANEGLTNHSSPSAP